MLVTYLDTSDSVWLDESGNFWRDGFPQLIAGGHEKIKIILVKSSPDRATEAAVPDNWERDTSWAAGGNSAMLTVDTDYKHLTKLYFSANPNIGDTSLSFQASGISTSEFSAFGEIYLYRADNSFDALGYSGISVDGNIITFALSDPVPAGDYLSAAIPQMPLASAFLAADESDIANGEWVFNIVVDSARLRTMTEFSSVSSVSIPGIELLFFRHLADSTVQKIRAYLWDSVSLRNSQGNPGNEAEPPTPVKDMIAANVASDIARGFEFEFSVNGEDWHDLQTLEDQWMRLRSKVGVNATWSEPIRLFAGAKGEKGDKGDKGDPGSSGLEDVFLSFEETEDATMECYFSPESGKRYIIDVEDFGTTTYLYIPGSYTVTDECQIWLRIEETAITNDLFRCNLSPVFNLVNEPDLSSRNLESGYRYIVISIQNNLAVCSEFTLGDENNIWYGEVE